MDTPEPCLLIFILFLCIALNSLFSLIEIAILESSPSKIDRLAEDGNASAIAAAKILDEPVDVLTIVQTGIAFLSILIGTITGAFIAPAVAVFIPLSCALPLSLFICIIIISYFALLLGEFLPKKVAFQDPERFLLQHANRLLTLKSLISPFVSFLSSSTNDLLLLFGYNPHVSDTVTEDEVKDLIEQGTEDGTFEKTEQNMIDHIFHMSDQTAYSLMTPRTQMQWLDLEDSDEKNLNIIKENPENVFAVANDNLDNFCGVIYAKDLLNAAIDEKSLIIADFIKKPLLIPRSMETFRVLEKFRDSSVHEAVVIDEYGGVVGFITLSDIVEEIIGDTTSSDESEPEQIIKRNENVWYIDGLCPIDDFKDMFNIDLLPEEAHDHYQTVGGFLTSFFGYLPQQHETCKFKDLTFEIISMDRARIDKILVTKR